MSSVRTVHFQSKLDVPQPQPLPSTNGKKDAENTDTDEYRPEVKIPKRSSITILGELLQNQSTITHELAQLHRLKESELHGTLLGIRSVLLHQVRKITELIEDTEGR